ncbi:hypothetical protein GSI_10961 [Ganoderma sinense ZZ0214-1]|uniref:Uncharacterized protein n=1 Tax=Ganoderma sinense ZZ0214-1 TaxID=1077348 RepID=A0A2G8S245_9APHY|nr:hypothetical protein GSI_10961 [Ganoderma sinense ZZ0214-1]
MTKVSKHQLPKDDMRDDDDDDTLNGSEPDTSPSLSPSPSDPATPEDSQGVKAAKAFGIGLACVVGIPVVAALGTVGGVLYGAGKLMEGVGRAMAAGPEAAFGAMDSDEQGKSKPESQRPGKKSK